VIKEPLKRGTCSAGAGYTVGQLAMQTNRLVSTFVAGSAK